MLENRDARYPEHSLVLLKLLNNSEMSLLEVNVVCNESGRQDKLFSYTK